MTTQGPGFRLILSDSLIDGGQRIRTCRPMPLSIDQVLKLLCDHFDFVDLCAQRGIKGKDFQGLGCTTGLHLTGLDGYRHVPIRSDQNLVDFLTNSRTKLPSVDVQLAAARSARAAFPSSHPEAATAPGGFTGQRGRLPRDQIEQLEDDRALLLRASDKAERRIGELERICAANKEDNARAISSAIREFGQKQDAVMKGVQKQLNELRTADEKILEKVDGVRQQCRTVSDQDKKHHQEMQELLADLRQNMESQFEVHGSEIENLKVMDEDLQAQITTNYTELTEIVTAHGEELKRLEDVKLDIEPWREAEEKMANHIDTEFTALKDHVTTTEAILRKTIEDAILGPMAKIADLQQMLADQGEAINNQFIDVNSRLAASITKAEEELAKARAEDKGVVERDLARLSDSTDKRFVDLTSDVKTKDININARTDELTAKCEKTFSDIHERLEEMVRVERARLGSIERDLAETTTKIRSDCRSEIERVRSDYEQEAARLDADLGDLHMKHDVTKQEINFFQSRLAEQKDWAQRQLTETATATRAAQVDAQEGLAASTKMLHALKDDAVSFREKMAKYISILQHSSDQHGDAITSLETQRSRMRSEVDALLHDHKAYTCDMDGWADDVRVKVERLFRALEPPRVEWRIARAQQRAKELKRPLAVKSPSFSLRGLREVQMEFYPEGTNNSPDGKAILRLFMPPVANVKYQCWVGRFTDGPHNYSGGNNLSVDLPIEQWKEEIGDDGSVPVVLEVLRDMNNDDESLSREVRVESP